MTNAYWRDFWGNQARRTNPYGSPGRIYTKGYHRGEDIGSRGQLINVPALRTGQIIDSGRSGMIGHWIAVKPDGDPNRRDIYTHMFEGTSRKSGRINAGDIIGRLAGAHESPGTAWTGPHLHFVISNLSHGGFDTSMPDYDPRPVITAALNAPGKPASSTPPVTRGTARKVKTDAKLINGRQGASTKTAVKQTLKDGTVGNFDGFIRGEKIAGNNIWFRGAYGGNYFWSGNFENKSTAGLKDLGTYKAPAVVKPKPKPVPKRTYARLAGNWFFYYQLANALTGNYSHNQKLAPGDYLVVGRDSRGPVKIRTPRGDVWVGTRNTRAPLISK